MELFSVEVRKSAKTAVREATLQTSPRDVREMGPQSHTTNVLFEVALFSGESEVRR